MKTSIWVCRHVETGELRTYDSLDIDKSEFVGGLDYWDDTPAQNKLMQAWYESTTPQFKRTWKLIKLGEDYDPQKQKNDEMSLL